MTNITSFNGLISAMIDATEHRFGTDIDELLLQAVHTNLDNERMDYQTVIHERDLEIKRLKAMLLTAKIDPDDTPPIIAAQDISPTGATTGGLTPHTAMFEPETLIVLASDSEGNVISPMDGRLTMAYYTPYTEYDGHLVDNDDHDDNPNAVPCVVFWPKR